MQYFHGSGGSNIGGLTEAATYFVSVNADDPDHVKVALFPNRVAALNNTNRIDLNPGGVTGTEHRLVKVEDQGTITSDAAVNLTATSNNDATIKDVAIEVSAIKIKSITPHLSTDGSTEVHVGGKYTFNSPGVTGQELARNTPDWDSFQLGLAFVGVTIIDTQLSIGHETNAFVGREADVVVNGGA